MISCIGVYIVYSLYSGVSPELKIPHRSRQRDFHSSAALTLFRFYLLILTLYFIFYWCLKANFKHLRRKKEKPILKPKSF